MPKANPNFPVSSNDIYQRTRDGKLTYERVVKVEEKGSDVNLAMHLLNDAWLDQYDCAVLVSNDNDIAGALTLLEKHHPIKKRGLITPFCAAQVRAKILSRPVNPDDHLTPARDLTENVHFVRQMREGVIASSQLPDIIPGTNFHKPISWCCGIVSRYIFEKGGYDFDAIIKRCIQKGYVGANNHVDPNFLKFDSEFKSWFPTYTKKQFDEIQALLHQFHL